MRRVRHRFVFVVHWERSKLLELRGWKVRSKWRGFMYELRRWAVRGAGGLPDWRRGMHAVPFGDFHCSHWGGFVQQLCGRDVPVSHGIDELQQLCCRPLRGDNGIALVVELRELLRWHLPGQLCVHAVCKLRGWFV